MKTHLLFLIITLLLHFGLRAEYIDIYRSGSFVSRISSWPVLQNAVDEAASGDSLVLSTGTFFGYRVIINKDLYIQGTQTSTDSSIISCATYTKSIFYIKKSTSITRVTFNDVIFDSAIVASTSSPYSTKSPEYDSLYGAAIKAFDSTDVRITGNTTFRNCLIWYIPSYSSIPYTPADLSWVGGAAIYSRGKLAITGNILFYNNRANYLFGGAVRCIGELSINGHVLFDSNYSWRGGAIAAQGKLTINGFTQFKNNMAKIGGAILADTCTLTIGDSTLISNNSCLNENSGNICLRSSNGILSNKTIIAGNHGGAIASLNSSLMIQDSVIIAGNDAGNTNFAAGIYNKGGNLSIKGGQIIGNYYSYDTIPGKGMAVYNDTINGLPAPVVSIANARIFNPTQSFKRAGEIFNADGVTFSSDSTWWGASDTSGLIFNEGSAASTLPTWIVADWFINKGMPIGYATSIPIDAYFRLNTGAAIPPKMFWMLAGLYSCDSGIFSPDTAFMLSSNYISTSYTTPYYSKPVFIIATVDADTFKNRFYATGLNTPSVQHTKGGLKIYPNPAQGHINIRSASGLQSIRVADLSGRIVLQQPNLKGYDNSLDLSPGLYIVEVQTSDGGTERQRVLVE